MTTSNAERTDLLHVFNMQRENLLIAVRGVTDEEARTRATVSQYVTSTTMQMTAPS